MELLLLPVFQLLYFVSHFLYSLAQNVVSTWHLLTTIWHSTIDKVSRSGLYKSTSGAGTSDPRGTASDPKVPGSLPQLWALRAWAWVRQCVRYVTTYQRDFVRSLKVRWYQTPNKSPSAVYTKGLAKTPRHLGVVLGQPSPSVALVASLIAQAASYGVKYVSVYDAFGEFLRRKDEVLEGVRKVAGGAYRFREREGLERELERETESEGGGAKSENSTGKSEGAENSPGKSAESPEKSGESETSTENPEKSPEKSDHSPENSPENSEARPVVEITFLGVQDGRQRLAAAAEKLARDHAGKFHLWAENSEGSENFLAAESSGSESLVPGLRKRFRSVGVEREEFSALKIPEISGMKTPEKCTVKIPEKLTVKIPENSGVKIPENLTVKIPENSGMKTPEKSTVKIPENSPLKIPEKHSALKIPENSREHSSAEGLGAISIPVLSQILSPNFPDPEVLISLGAKSTLGYPPWGLRATEIHFLGLSEAYLGLARVMEAYAGCQQRWGR